jgi:cytidyltransferase-like protein
MTDIVCVSGGFDPLHIGHLEMFKEAAKHGPLTVIINSDEWLLRKKGFCFLPWEQRAAIIRDLRYVNDVAAVDDADDTVCEALARIKPRAFANGGDRKPGTTPEVNLCNELGVELLWNIGGGKSDSSSEIARKAWVERSWGRYVTLDEGEGFKVKKLIIAPGESISLQYHNHRNEYWYVTESIATVRLSDKQFNVAPGQLPVVVESGVQHQLMNMGDKPLVIIEIQSGEYMGEDDIIRLHPHGEAKKA